MEDVYAALFFTFIALYGAVRLLWWIYLVVGCACLWYCDRITGRSEIRRMQKRNLDRAERK